MKVERSCHKVQYRTTRRGPAEGNQPQEASPTVVFAGCLVNDINAGGCSIGEKSVGKPGGASWVGSPITSRNRRIIVRHAWLSPSGVVQLFRFLFTQTLDTHISDHPIKKEMKEPTRSCRMRVVVVWALCGRAVLGRQGDGRERRGSWRGRRGEESLKYGDGRTAARLSE